MAAVTVTPASVIPSVNANWSFGIAAGTITIGQPVAVNADGTISPANANAGSLILATAAGIAATGAAVGQRVYYITSDPALVHGITGAGISPGQPVFLDDTAGGMTVTYADLDDADYTTLLGQIGNPETTMRLVITPPVVKAST